MSRKHSPTGERFFVKEYPKSNKPRLVQIQQASCLLLREHMLDEGVRESSLLFASAAGTPISRNNFRTKVWLRALETAKINGTVTFHNLRAAHASTWLLAGGADLQVVKERLGHNEPPPRSSTSERFTTPAIEHSPRTARFAIGSRWHVNLSIQESTAVMTAE